MDSILIDDFGDILWFINTKVILLLLLGRSLRTLVVGIIRVVGRLFYLANAIIRIEYLFFYIS